MKFKRPVNVDQNLTAQMTEELTSPHNEQLFRLIGK